MVFNREPVLLLGLVQAVIGLLAAFAIPLSAEQVGALMAVTAAVLSFIARSQVYAPASVAQIRSEQGGA